MKKITFLLLAILFGFGINAQTPGSIITSDQDTVYVNESVGKIKQLEVATGYENIYYTWEYGIAGDTIIVPTTKYSSDKIPYDGDNDGVQDSLNGKPLYYNYTSGKYMNVYKVFGDIFGGGKVVTVTRYAHDADSVLATTSTSIEIKVLAEKKLVAGKITSSQENVRETENIEVVLSEEDASEGFGAVTYSWSINKIGGAVQDLSVTSSSCDISDKTFVDYGMEPGDRVSIVRYATDELGTVVEAKKSIKILSSVAITPPTDKSYIISATIKEVGFNPSFNLIKGDLVNDTLGNVGARLMAVNIGGLRNPKYVLAAELEPSGRTLKISDVTYPYVKTAKYDLKYRIDPVNYTYSLAVKNADSTNFVTLVTDQVYYKVNGVSNNIEFDHYEPKNFAVENFKLTPITAVELPTLPTDKEFFISATIESTGPSSKFFLLKGDEVINDSIASKLWYSPAARNPGYIVPITGVKASGSDIMFTDVLFNYSIGKKYDIQYRIDPVKHTYTLKVRENGTKDYITFFENKSFFTVADSINKIEITHYDTYKLNVENVKVAEVTAFPIENAPTDRKFTFSATIQEAGPNASLVLMNGDKLRLFVNVGPNLVYDKAGRGINTILGLEGSRRIKPYSSDFYATAPEQKYDIEFNIDPVSYYYTFKIKVAGAEESTFVTVVDDQPFFTNQGMDPNPDTYNEFELDYYDIYNLNIENVKITIPANTESHLEELKVNDVLVTDFDASILEYNVELPEGTTDMPIVTVVAKDSNASVVITDATAIPGTTTVEVTAEDGVTKTTYKINFTVSLGLDDISLNGAIYPNPTTGVLNVEFKSTIKSIEVYNVTGTLVKVQEGNNTMRTQLNISNFKSGVYLIKVISENNVAISRIVKK